MPYLDQPGVQNMSADLRTLADQTYAGINHTHNYAPLDSPVFTGTPTAPTAASGTDTTQIATTAFVQDATSSYVLKAGDTMTGDLTVYTNDDPAYYVKSIYSSKIGDNVPSSGAIMGQYKINDVHDDPSAYFNLYRGSTDRLTAAIGVMRKNASDAEINNYLQFQIDSGGNALINTSYPQAWRNELEIGAQQYTTNGSAITSTTAQDTTLCNTGSLASGYHYIILAEATFAANANGRRVIFLSTSSTGANVDRYCYRTQAPVSSVQTCIQLVYLCHPANDTTYYLRAYQNSGGNLSVTGGIRVFKLSAWN